MRKLGLALLALCLGLAPAQAQAPVVPSSQFTIQIAGTIAAQTRIVQGRANAQINVTTLALIPAATAVVTFTYGTGTNCGTGTTNLTGAMTFAAGAVMTVGDGYGSVMVVPSGNDLCITIATAAAPGWLSYSLF